MLLADVLKDAINKIIKKVLLTPGSDSSRYLFLEKSFITEETISYYLHENSEDNKQILIC